MKKSAIYISILALVAGGLSSCNEDPVLPPVSEPPCGWDAIGDGSYEKPLSVWQVSLGYTEPEELPVWATGYIVGWIDTDASPTFSLEQASARYTVPAGSSSNMLMCYELPWEVEKDDTGAPIIDEEGYPTYKLDEDGEKIFIGGDDFWKKCITVKLTDSPYRNDLNLTNNPINLGRQVTLKGTSGGKYCGAYGLLSISNYCWGDKGVYEEPQEPVPPMPAIEENVTFNQVTEFAGPGQYLLVFDNSKMAGPVENPTYSYGYLPVKNVTPEDGKIITSTLNAYMFYEVEGGYEIRDGYGRYVWWDSDPTHKSFQLSANRGTEGDIWSVTPKTNGTFEIKNVEMGVFIQYSSNYNNVSAYTNTTGPLPALYKRN